MKKIFLAVALFASVFGAVKAQSGMQMGANLGPTMGLTMKYNFNQLHALEGIVGYNMPHDGVSMKFMYQYHIALVDALRLYMGAGMNIGALHMGKHHSGDFALGIVPTIGLEYAFRGAPLTLGFGYDPAINFTTHNQMNDVAFKLRFRF